jgi:hypothetical protein
MRWRIRAIAALFLASLAPNALAYEQTESDRKTEGFRLVSSGLAVLAAIESTVQEVASMDWKSGSNEAMPTGQSGATATAEATPKAATAEKKGANVSIDGSPTLPSGTTSTLDVTRNASVGGGERAAMSEGSTASGGAASLGSPTTASSTGSSGATPRTPSLTMPASEADRLRNRSNSINGSLGTIGNWVKDAQDRNRTPLNPTGQDKKWNEGGTPIDRDAASKAKFGAKGDLSLNTIADNREKEPDPFEEFLKEQRKKQGNREKEKSEEEKKKEEQERQELEQKMTELANKPPPFTLQDYYDFRDLIAKKNKMLGPLAENQPEFAKKAQIIFDEFQSRDGDESKKQAFRDFVENSRESDRFQNPIIVDPIRDTHREGVSH